MRELTTDELEMIKRLENLGHSDLIERYLNEVLKDKAAKSFLETQRLLTNYLNNLLLSDLNKEII